MNMKNNKGVSVPEVLIFIGIMVAIFGLSFASFTSISDYNTVDKHSAVVQYNIDRARQLTINSRNNSQYSIRFTSSTINVFEGTIYSVASSVTALPTPLGVQLQAVSLTGGVSMVSFSKITGEPSATGTVIYKSTRKASTTKTITIYGTGHSEVQ